MNRFNSLLNSHFKTCVVLAETRDSCRTRTVRLFDIPDHPDLVGLSDGVDSWISPVSIHPMGVDVLAARDRVKSGGPVSRARVQIQAPLPKRPIKVERKPILC